MLSTALDRLDGKPGVYTPPHKRAHSEDSALKSQNSSLAGSITAAERISRALERPTMGHFQSHGSSDCNTIKAWRKSSPPALQTHTPSPKTSAKRDFNSPWVRTGPPPPPDSTTVQVGQFMHLLKHVDPADPLYAELDINENPGAVDHPVLIVALLPGDKCRFMTCTTKAFTAGGRKRFAFQHSDHEQLGRNDTLPFITKERCSRATYVSSPDQVYTAELKSLNFLKGQQIRTDAATVNMLLAAGDKLRAHNAGKNFLSRRGSADSGYCSSTSPSSRYP